MKIKNSIRPYIIFIAFCLASCDKQLEVKPPAYTSNEGIIYESDASAVTVLAGIYTAMAANNTWSLSVYPSLSADELVASPSAGNQSSASAFYRNNLNSSNMADFDYWSTLYQVIYFSNSAIQGLSKSTGTTQAVRRQLLGESKFMRALCYFYLVNLYGDIAIITGTDYNKNRLLSRSPKEEAWQLILADLAEAEELLSPDFLDGTVMQTTEERVRPTKWAAAALLARVYLYRGAYAEAEAEATKVLNQSSTFALPSLNSAFVKNNEEAIWQIQPIDYGANAPYARLFVLPSTGFTGFTPFYLSNDLISQFEAGDSRINNWIGSVIYSGTKYFYPYKYKVNLPFEPVTEYFMMFRLAEQYLIRAEARIKQNNIADGIIDINVVRTRARDTATLAVPNPLPPLAADLSSEQALQAVNHERRIELFTELGDRWFDLKRSGQVDAVMSLVTPQKGGGDWNPNWAYYPLQGEELQKAPNLKQTPGYN